MNDPEEFFSANHNRLLGIATWAKYLSWIVLIVFILWAIGTYLQELNYFRFYQTVSTRSLNYRDFLDLLLQEPSFGFSIFIELVGILLRGIVYFLVLKAVSLGLNMIVETDINYREKLEH